MNVLNAFAGMILAGLIGAAPGAAQDRAAPRVVPAPWPDGLAPTVPKGFTISVFARIDTSTGWMAVAANGDVFLSEPATGAILLLRDTRHRGRADLVTTFATGFSRPHGLVLRDGYLYVADVPDIWRIAVKPGAAIGGARERVTTASDSVAGIARDLEIDRRGHVFVGYAARDKPAGSHFPDGTIQRLSSGGAATTFATGLGAVVGMAINPRTGDLFVTANKREQAPSDFLARVRNGQDFASDHAAVAPELQFEPGSFPMELVFDDRLRFPAPYRNGAFVALHGGGGPQGLSGYSVAFVPFHGSVPTGQIFSFVTGFAADTKLRQIWGRPAGLAVSRDGSLLIADDIGHTVWRVSYRGR